MVGVNLVALVKEGVLVGTVSDVSVTEEAGLGDGGLPRLRDQLNWLMANVSDPRGRPYTTASLTEEIKRQGAPISESYVGHLRQGVRDNISALRLGAIARSFAVPVDFFFDPEVEAAVHRAVDALNEVRVGSRASIGDEAVQTALRNAFMRHPSASGDLDQD